MTSKASLDCVNAVVLQIIICHTEQDDPKKTLYHSEDHVSCEDHLMLENYYDLLKSTISVWEACEDNEVAYTETYFHWINNDIFLSIQMFSKYFAIGIIYFVFVWWVLHNSVPLFY